MTEENKITISEIFGVDAIKGQEIINELKEKGNELNSIKNLIKYSGIPLTVQSYKALVIGQIIATSKISEDAKKAAEGMLGKITGGSFFGK